MERSTSWPVLRRGPLSLFLMLVPSLSSAAGPTDDTEELCSSQLIPVTHRVGVSETPTKQGPTRPGCLTDGNSGSAPPRPVLGVCVFNRYRAFLMTGAWLQSDLCGGQLLVSWARPGWDCGFLQRERTCVREGAEGPADGARPEMGKGGHLTSARAAPSPCVQRRHRTCCKTEVTFHWEKESDRQSWL